jgi:hypothetical protein
VTFVIAKLSIQGQFQDEIICHSFPTSKAGNSMLSKVEEGVFKKQ